MAQNAEKDYKIEAKLCIKCLQMYGNPSFKDMCSMCFKNQQKKDIKLEQKLLKLQKPIENASNIFEQENKTQTDTGLKRELPIQQKTQKVNGKCHLCNKKTGLLGYQCKHCVLSFCKFHRLPQDHECEVDFISLGRKQIKTQNPGLNSKKLQQI